MSNPPPQIIAGPDAYAAIEGRMGEIRAAMEQHRALSAGTNFAA
jgi:hypothetical protein